MAYVSVRSALECCPVVSWAGLVTGIINAVRATKWDRKTVLKHQQERFKDILAHVLTHSPFYKTLYAQHGIGLKDIGDLQLQDLPVIDKAMMMDNYDEFVCDRRLNKKELEAFLLDPANLGKKFKRCFTVMHSSGSTGRPGIFVYDVDAWNLTKSLAITRVSRIRFNRFGRQRLAFIGAADGLYAGISLVSDAPGFLYNFKPFPVCEPWDLLLEHIQAFSPDIISGYSSSVYMLALEQIKGNLSLHPARIICSADPLTAYMREAVKDAFRVEPVNFYASSESLCMAAECLEHDGLHMNEDWNIFEVEDGAVGNVRYGSLILTTLFNRAQPLIRYRMEDHVTVTSEPCACGSAYHRIMSIGGRSEDFLYFKLSDGKTAFIHPSEIVEFFVPGLEKFQLRQVEPLHLHMLLVTSGDAASVREAAQRRMHKLLVSCGLEKAVRFTTECVDEIPLDSRTGKFRLVIPFEEGTESMGTAGK
ncbi:MAG: hypothetical protein DSZ23_04225 [Thermodesulfatator sp.]|nr:MAG: hypothetical protein DSZ23_04225 [Thermodesulfatator sp.]